MRLSTVFELLLIFLLIAFAAYGRVIDRDEVTLSRSIRAVNESRQTNMGMDVMSLKQATENVNKYCTCNENICNCCRNFNIPIVQLKGPGCASLQYLEEDKLAVQLSVGENILTSTIVNGQKPKAVCFPMPGGLTKFCGRIYSIQREADSHFKACLGLELQSSSELEAALRVSCFRFGPDGVKLRPAEQLPVVEIEKPAEDDDDDDDIFGLGDDDDDDDDDDDEDDDAPEGNAVPDSSTPSDDAEDDDDDDDDVLGLGALLDIFTGDDDSDKKKKKQQTSTAAPILPFTIPLLTKPTSGTPIIQDNEASETFNNVKPTITSTENTQTFTDSLDNAVSDVSERFDDSITTQMSDEVTTEQMASQTEQIHSEEPSTIASPSDDKIEAAGSDKIEYISKPVKPMNLKKINKINDKPSLTSSSINAIKNDGKKPSVLQKPIKPDSDHIYGAVTEHSEHDSDEDDDEEEEDDDDILGTSDLDDEDEDDDDDDDDEKYEFNGDSDEHKDDEDDDKIDDDKFDSVEDDENEHEDEHEDEKTEDHHESEDEDDLIDDDDDDDDAEEDAVLSALVEDDKDDVKITDKVANNEAGNHEEDDSDYGLGLAELLARKRHMRSGRQSKVMRL